MGKSNKTEYFELSKAEVAGSRNIVISECSRGGFTIAQQLVAKEENGKSTTVFMKGAFHVEDVHGLYNLRDAINLAIQITESPEQENEPNDWDDEEEEWPEED